MFKNLVIATVFGFGALSAQGASTEPQGRHFNEPRTYKLSIFENEAECRERQSRGGWMNCYRVINFSPDGRATVMLTDIMNPARDEIRSGKILIKQDGGGDMPEKLVYVLSHNKRHLIEWKTNHVWDLEMERAPRTFRK